LAGTGFLARRAATLLDSDDERGGVVAKAFEAAGLRQGCGLRRGKHWSAYSCLSPSDSRK